MKISGANTTKNGALIMSLNRRAFLGGLFFVLPAATTYARVWKALAKTSMPDEAMLCHVTCESGAAQWFSATCESVTDGQERAFTVKSIGIPGLHDNPARGNWIKCEPPADWPSKGILAVSEGEVIDLSQVCVIEYRTSSG